MSIPLTGAAIAAAERAERERQRPAQLLRAVDRLSLWALDEVERVNLAGGGACPAEVAEAIAELQLLAEVALVPPASSWEAHEALLELQSALLGLPEEGAA